MNVKRVLVGALDTDDIGVLGEMVHNLNLAQDVVVVLLANEFLLGDGFAGVRDAGGLVGAEMGGAELALAKLFTDGVEVLEDLGLLL